MDSPKTDAVTTAADQRVPEDLLARLHDANQKLHDARKALEAAMDASEPSHQSGVDEANKQVHAAEVAVEQISEQIHQAISSLPIK
jgi:predicted  nucleic acid-binding Zn-ribbon protein